MKELEKRIKQHLEERGWDNLRPSDVAKSIMIEGAELLEHFQWENRDLSEVRADLAKIDGVKKELADVMIYALEMSVLLGLDTKEIINAKLDYVAKKYPAELMRKNSQKGSGSGSDSEYWRIKKEYRSKGVK
ncbi:MAG: putative pyrophosphatase [Parcubacteria group bacterium Gr01-1014_19]|nr:MAG: putative pyrophosphatase [Parcubacteria group bacterium Gr01-1014_19]